MQKPTICTKNYNKMDTFICGTCQGAFNDIEMFMQHKQTGCSRQTPDVIQLHVDDSGEVTEVTGADGVMEDVSSTSPNTLAFLNEMSADGHLTAMQGADGDGTTHTYIILNEGDGSITAEAMHLESVPVSGGGEDGTAVGAVSMTQAPGLAVSVAGGGGGGGAGTVVVDAGGSGEGVLKKIPGRRGRRPKKLGEIKIEPMEAVASIPMKPEIPEKDKDGKLRCPNCHRAFNKERHFKTHKCLASSLYIDISKREVKIDSGDEEELEDTEAGAIDDDQEEYRAPPEAEAEHSEDSENLGQEEEGQVERNGNTFKNIQLHTDADTEAGCKDKNTQGIEDVPIFRNEEEKMEFESTLNVDLSCIDHMFKVHVIDQDINENAGTYGRGQLTSLSLYSCTVCDKVFKTLSHMRLHCLVHTDLKPFRCSKCQYTTNTKGNLYTHMRKHTGQYYQCKHCEFRSVNKSHLVEHEATHDKKRHPCAICHKDYATGKSLINHVRKYHSNSRKGQQYLQTFLQGRQASGSTVIHQCHVCNRKFKKKIDRDRHLFVHDIRDVNMTHQCQLCEYQASRRVYLEKHYTKHRVLYCCSLCNDMFLSTVKLLEHLSSAHAEDQSVVGGDEELFERCINSSLYLPEPDEQMPVEDKQFVNLPPELSSTAVNNTTTTITTTTTSGGDAATLPESMVVVVEGGSGLSESCASEMVDSSSLSVMPGNLVTEGGEKGVGDSGGKPLQQGEGTVLESQVKEEEEMVVVGGSEGAERITVMVSEDGVSSVLPSASVSNILPSSTITMTAPAEDKTAEEEGKDGPSASTNPPLPQDGGENLSSSPPSNELQSVMGDSTLSQASIAHPLPDTVVIPLAPNPGLANDQDEEFEEDLDNPELDKDLEVVNIDDSDALPVDETMVCEEGKGENKKSIVERLGFRPMNMQIFQKMRETFGSEECEFCGRLFYTKQDYEPHLRTHTGDRPFRCTECAFKAITRENLRRHMEREHENVKFPCKDCDFVASNRTRLWNHQLTHLGISGLQCPHCPEKFETIKRLRVHMAVSHPELPREELDKLTGYKHKMQGKMGRRSYKCPYCERVFIRANSELQKHIWIHEGVKPFKCSLCTYACRSKNNLQAHMLRHSSHKPFACQECGKAYKSKTALRWHVRSHKTGNLFKCDKCPYEAQQRSHLKRHMETHEVVKRFMCRHCDYSANTVGYMKIHYARSHKGLQYSPELSNNLPGTSATAAPSDQQVFRCVSCDYRFGNLSDLKRHLKIKHHVPVQDFAGIEQMQICAVEVVQCAEETPVAETTEVVEPASVMAAPETGSSTELDEKTVSAVSLLQQIMTMQSQGALGQQEIKVMSEDGQLLSVNPETIIVQQQDGQQVFVTNNDQGLENAGQYIIQYVTPDDPSADPSMEGVPMEIQTIDTTESVEFMTE
ncbi:hypothetical protein ACOMHN_032189 [Nucella lapillus]